MDHFHALLVLEQEVAARGELDGVPGEVAHFYAVSTYVLQHPESMGYTAEALEGLREAVRDHLAGRAALADIRRRVRAGADGPARITRREGDEVPRWGAADWPLTVADVLAGGVVGYGARVAAWAVSVLEAIDAAGVRHGQGA
jgi:hypothetical protein